MMDDKMYNVSIKALWGLLSVARMIDLEALEREVIERGSEDDLCVFQAVKMLHATLEGLRNDRTL